MVEGYIEICVCKYLLLVWKMVKYYGIEFSLILGIMEVELVFNLYVVSYVNVIGLM